MKYLIPLFAIFLLTGCGGAPANQQADEDVRPTRLDDYLNTVVAKVPDWGNNEMTRNILQDSLCIGFAKNMQADNLLSDFVFTIESIDNSVYKDSMDIRFNPMLLTSDNSTVKSPIQFQIYALVSDSLARTLTKTQLYKIPSFSRDPKDTICSPSLNSFPPSVDVDNKIVTCDLGLKGITIHKLEPFTPASKK